MLGMEVDLIRLVRPAAVQERRDPLAGQIEDFYFNLSGMWQPIWNRRSIAEGIGIILQQIELHGGRYR